jgi:hypothetical protein
MNIFLMDELIEAVFNTRGVEDSFNWFERKRATVQLKMDTRGEILSMLGIGVLIATGISAFAQFISLAAVGEMPEIPWTQILQLWLGGLIPAHFFRLFLISKKALPCCWDWEKVRHTPDKHLNTVLLWPASLVVFLTNLLLLGVCRLLDGISSVGRVASKGLEQQLQVAATGEKKWSKKGGPVAVEECPIPTNASGDTQTSQGTLHLEGRKLLDTYERVESLDGGLRYTIEMVLGPPQGHTLYGDRRTEEGLVRYFCAILKREEDQRNNPQVLRQVEPEALKLTLGKKVLNEDQLQKVGRR